MVSSAEAMVQYVANCDAVMWANNQNPKVIKKPLVEVASTFCSIA